MPVDLSALSAADEVTLLSIAESARAVGFDAPYIGELERILPGRFDRVRLPAIQWELRERKEDAAIWARLFAYDDVVSPAEASAAIEAGCLNLMKALGLLREDDDGIRASLRLMPFESLYILADPPGDAETVMGPGPTTVELIGAARFEDYASVLDVGCGAGSIAILAAKAGSSQVLGVDISPRAVALSRVNAGLNGVDVEFRVGDLTAPAGEERFALVIAQPAFVIQPDDVPTTTYLHGGRMGDELTMRLLGELAPRMNESGQAIIRVDAPAHPERTLHERCRAALGEFSTALDLLAIISAGHPPAEQAVAYAAESDPSLGERYRDLVTRYRAHIHRVGIQTHLSALLVLHRVQPSEKARTISITAPALRRASAEEITRYLTGVRLAEADLQDLLEARIGVSPHARIIDQRNPSNSQAAAPRVQFAAGLAQDHEISDAVGVLLEVLGTGRQLDDGVTLFAERCGAAPGEIREQMIGFVRDSLRRGLLVAI